MLSLGWILIILLLIVIVVLVLLLLFGVFKPIPVTNPALVDELLNTISLQQGWNPLEGKPVSGERGQCLLYSTFSIETPVVDGLTPLGKLSSLPAEFQCDDGFTQSLVKLSRVCAQEQCLGTNGLLYTQGQEELFYAQCGTTSSCPNGRSAVILNFDVSQGVVTSKARCINTVGSTFNLGVCPANTSTTGANYFLNVDNVSITEDVGLVRIRAPGTVDCLVPQNGNLAVTPCLSAPDEGYTWFITPKLCIPDTDGTECYPEQIVTIPPNWEDIDLEDPKEVELVLKTTKSIQMSNGKLVLSPYALCTNYSEEGCVNPPGDPNYCNGYNPPSEPINDTCAAKTAIISAYNYSSIF
jgi:hypothetical protein